MFSTHFTFGCLDARIKIIIDKKLYTFSSFKPLARKGLGIHHNNKNISEPTALGLPTRAREAPKSLLIEN